MAKRHTDTWKKAELILAALLGGKRRGADFRGENGGKSDIIKPGYSIESKHSRRPTYGLMKEAIAQAEANRACPGDIPFAVIHKEREEYKDSLIVMRLETFVEFFMNVQPEE